MATDSNSTPDRSREQACLLRCGQCGRTEECSVAGARCYARTGWPQCCGGVMAYFVATEKPGPDDTTLDVPPLRPAKSRR